MRQGQQERPVGGMSDIRVVAWEYLLWADGLEVPPGDDWSGTSAAAEALAKKSAQMRLAWLSLYPAISAVRLMLWGSHG